MGWFCTDISTTLWPGQHDPWQPLADCPLLTMLLLLFLAGKAMETHCSLGKLHVEREHGCGVGMEEL